MSQIISKSTRIPDRLSDKANILDLFPTSNPNIYSNLAVDSPLGSSDHCLITLQHNFVSYKDRSFSSQNIFRYNKADWDSLRTFFIAYPSYSGFSNDPSSFATIISNAIQLGMDLFIPSSDKPGKKLLQSCSIFHVQRLSKLKTTASKHGNTTKLQNLELHLYKPTINAPKPSTKPKPPLPTESAIRLLHVKMELAPFDP